MRLCGHTSWSPSPRYCPQFDALFDLLTVREHLELFARLKGINAVEVPQAVQSSMEFMDLLEFENKRAGTLSGGNKRKLCVAIALIGEPVVVFLDEPSTGMVRIFSESCLFLLRENHCAVPGSCGSTQAVEYHFTRSV
jgi:ABC-type multidrug transport system ATPase subunit